MRVSSYIVLGQDGQKAKLKKERERKKKAMVEEPASYIGESQKALFFRSFAPVSFIMRAPSTDKKARMRRELVINYWWVYERRKRWEKEENCWPDLAVFSFPPRN